MIIEVNVRNKIQELSGLDNKSVTLGGKIRGVHVPYIVVRRTSGLRMDAHDGGAGCVKSTFSVIIYTDGYARAKTIARKLYDLGPVAGASRILLSNESDVFEIAPGLYNTILDYSIYYKED